MIDLEKDIEDNLNDLSIEFVYLLRKNNLLFQFLKNYITNIICSKVDLTINIDELNEDFCRKNNIKDENNLITFLALKSMTLEDHKKNL